MAVGACDAAPRCRATECWLGRRRRCRAKKIGCDKEMASDKARNGKTNELEVELTASLNYDGPCEHHRECKCKFCTIILDSPIDVYLIEAA